MVREALPSSLFGTSMAPAMANCLHFLISQEEGLRASRGPLLFAKTKTQRIPSRQKGGYTGQDVGRGRQMKSDKEGVAGHSSCFVLFFGLSSG